MNQASATQTAGESYNVSRDIVAKTLLTEEEFEEAGKSVDQHEQLFSRIEKMIPGLETSAGKIEKSTERIALSRKLLEHFAPGVASSAKDMATAISGAAEEITSDFKGMKSLGESLIKEFEIVIDNKRSFVENLDELCIKERDINLRRLKQKMDEVDQTETIVEREHAIRMAKFRNDAAERSLEFGNLKARLATLAAENKRKKEECPPRKKSILGPLFAWAFVGSGVVLSTIGILVKAGVINY